MNELKDIARTIIEEAKALGADQAQCFLREKAADARRHGRSRAALPGHDRRSLI